ncbi:MAG: PaaI family thioesterase [Clostridiales bacterium]|nr:PaaI family thioesterase [Clostridiales bacterium]
MKYKVIRKQENSKLCIVCGFKNVLGLKSAFYELENETIVAVFTPKEVHQSYPGRLHGGIASAILDETIGRAILMRDKNAWGVTVELHLKYHKPISLNEELRVVGRITSERKRIFEGTGEILLPNGEVAVSAYGKYFKMPIDQIAGSEMDELDWQVVDSENVPEEIEL